MSPEDVEQLPDAAARAEAAIKGMAEAQAMLAAYQRLRDVAFNELRHEHGETIRAIADRYGVSKSMVATVTG